MTTEIRMPIMITESEGGGTLLRWLVKTGDYVEIDQDIAEIKVGEEIINLPSPVDGWIISLCAQEGNLVGVEEVMAQVREADFSEESEDQVPGRS